MKRKYREAKNLNAENKKLLGYIIRVVEEYGSEGIKLTLRQLYYQLVSAALIANKVQSYKKIGIILVDARMAGIVDWDIIEDRVRVPKMHSEFDDINDIIKAAVNSYRLDRWRDQEEYVEVWVEKDALAGILEPLTNEYHVHLMVNKGYSSASAMHDASLRIRRQMHNDKKCTILYFGDHDPSGEDMVRDIQDRLDEFGCDVTVEKIALTMKQIRQYKPPPNPVKMSDKRADGYIEKHGRQSWELDALKPQVLRRLVTSSIEAHLDMKKFNKVKQQEHDDIVALQNFAEEYSNQ